MFSFLFKKTEHELVTQENNHNIIVNTDGIEALYNFIEKNAGISLQKSKVLVKNHIIALCERYNITSFLSLLEEVKKDKQLFTELVDTVTIHETYFFREKEQIVEALEQYKNNSPLSILSAPSSSGEEAYSIAILALEMGITNFHVIGIDISSTIIAKANRSLYSQRSVNFLSTELLKKYFIETKDGYSAKEDLKQYVTFKQVNLFEDNICHLGRFDIIFSRNMFIYFQDDKKIEAYKQLESLKKDENSSIHLGHADISSRLSQYISNKHETL